MAERSVDQILNELVAGTADVASVQLSEAVDVAEALAESEGSGLLEALAERVFPRLLKKERIEDIEGIWLACCTANVLPKQLLYRTADRLVARGFADEASELLNVFADALVEDDQRDEALEVLIQGLEWTGSRELLESAAQLLSQIYAEASNLEEVLRSFRLLRPGSGSEAAEALKNVIRALRFSPGTFLRWIDWTVAQVVSTNGVTARVRHPSGAIEEVSVDAVPPPQIMKANAHEVLRLYKSEELKDRWRAKPTQTLMSLLDEQGGVLSVPGLKGILVPRVLEEARFNEVLAALKSECSLGREERPRYESRRRLFIAPGCKAPKPKSSSNKSSKPQKKEETSNVSPLTTKVRVETPRTLSIQHPRWVDLTLMPEIRALISGVENEKEELTRELNVDLPLRLEEARAHGDLRENAEYDAAKERLRFVQARIDQLRTWLAQLHELSRIRLLPGKVTTMSVVTVAEEGNMAERTLRLVPAELPEPRPGDVSVGTPYGRALLGHEVGDVVVVRLPRRTERLEIVKVVDPGEKQQSSPA